LSNPADAGAILVSMPLLPRTKSRQLFEKLNDLEGQMRDMQGKIDALQDQHADDEVEALAAERVRSGAAERTQSGAEALGELGIDVR
jgi:TolA-binding protein